MMMMLGQGNSAEELEPVRRSGEGELLWIIPEKERYWATPERAPIYSIPELQPITTPEKEEPVWTTFVIEEGVTYEPVEYDLPAEPVVTIPTAPEPVFRQVHMVHYDEPPEVAAEVEVEPEVEPEDGGITFDPKKLLWLLGGGALLLALVELARLRREVR